MPIFGKQFRPGMGGGVEERLAALEAHVCYMQERLEFYANQNEKKLSDMAGGSGIRPYEKRWREGNERI